MARKALLYTKVEFKLMLYQTSVKLNKAIVESFVDVVCKRLQAENPKIKFYNYSSFDLVHFYTNAHIEDVETIVYEMLENLILVNYSLMNYVDHIYIGYDVKYTIERIPTIVLGNKNYKLSITEDDYVILTHGKESQILDTPAFIELCNKLV